MKKLFTFATLVVVIFTVSLYAQTPRPEWYRTSQFDYDGDWDDTYWSETITYDFLSSMTSLGRLARYSDVIGMGVVTNKIIYDEKWGFGHFAVIVDYAVAGCTNGMSIIVYDGEEGGGGTASFPQPPRDKYMPTNNSRIVFAVYTNDFGFRSNLFWESPEIPVPPNNVLTNYTLRYLNRTWWYAERDDGELFTHFTNIVQAVRFDPNWTNFFYLCRDGANSTSARVREDSFWDMRYLAFLTTDEQAQFMLDDPLVDPKHKMCILRDGWRDKFRLKRSQFEGDD